MDLSISAQLPTTNDLGGLKRRIVNDGEDLENQGPLDLTQNVGKKKRASVVSSEPLEENHPIPNGDSVVGSEYVDVKPEPIVLSDAAQLQVTNGLRNRGLKRKIGSDYDDQEEKDQGPAPAVTKSREEETKLKMKREIPPVVTFELPEEESSSEEEEPIRYLLFVFI